MKTRGRRAGSRHRRRSNSLQFTARKVLDQIHVANDNTRHNRSSASIKVLSSSSQQQGKIKPSPQQVVAPPPPLPPPLCNLEKKMSKLGSPWQCPLTCAQLVEQRSHLHDVAVLQKRSIFVKGLSKSQFPSPKKIKEYFSMYGKICKFVMDPKGLSQDGLDTGTHGKNTVSITYLTERSALHAIRATDGKYLESTNCKVQVTLARSRYCSVFLSGKHCQDLNCVLLHELIVDENNDCKKKEKSNGILEEECSTMKLTVLTREKSKKGIWSVQPLASTKEEVKTIHSKNNDESLDSSSASPTNTTSTSLLNEEKSAVIGKESVVENQSTPLPPTSKKARQEEFDPKCTPMEDVTDIHHLCIDQVSSIPKRFKERDIVNLGLPAKQLFKTKKLNSIECVISPPKERGVDLEVEGYDNPWGLKSPAMIEKDNFVDIPKKYIRSQVSRPSIPTMFQQGFIPSQHTMSEDKMRKFQSKHLVGFENQKIISTQPLPVPIAILKETEREPIFLSSHRNYSACNFRNPSAGMYTSRNTNVVQPSMSQEGIEGTLHISKIPMTNPMQLPYNYLSSDGKGHYAIMDHFHVGRPFQFGPLDFPNRTFISKQPNL